MQTLREGPTIATQSSSNEQALTLLTVILDRIDQKYWRDIKAGSDLAERAVIIYKADVVQDVEREIRKEIENEVKR